MSCDVMGLQGLRNYTIRLNSKIVKTNAFRNDKRRENSNATMLAAMRRMTSVMRTMMTTIAMVAVRVQRRNRRSRVFVVYWNAFV